MVRITKSAPTNNQSVNPSSSSSSTSNSQTSRSLPFTSTRRSAASANNSSVDFCTALRRTSARGNGSSGTGNSLPGRLRRLVLSADASQQLISNSSTSSQKNSSSSSTTRTVSSRGIVPVTNSPMMLPSSSNTANFPLGEQHNNNNNNLSDLALSRSLGGDEHASSCHLGQERPAKLNLLLQMEPLSKEEQIKHTWSPEDHSNNIYIVHHDPMIFHRQPVAQSTDAARGRQSYSRGLHLWRITWSRSQRGTHAVVGVGTKEASLNANTYTSLLGGHDAFTWGWNLSTNTLHHNSVCLGEYPSLARQQRLICLQAANATSSSNSASVESGGSTAFQDALLTGSTAEGILGRETDTEASVAPRGGGGRGLGIRSALRREGVVTASSASSSHVNHSPATTNSSSNSAYRAPDEIFVVLDMDEGTLGFMVDGEFLGYAFSGLKGLTLYPMVSAVWGHCEVTLEYFNGLPPEPHALMHLCRKRVRAWLETQQVDLWRVEELPLPRLLKDYLLYRYL